MQVVLSAGPCFFVSYSHDDADYVKRLYAHLIAHDLPVWTDTDLAWGSSFPREIVNRISRALAVIVVMSPGAQKSDWVEREILEGQHQGQQFLPILRSGSRLFLLASSNYFDARDGALPEVRELKQLRALRDASEPGQAVGPRPILQPPRAAAPVPSARLTASAGLGKLESLLESSRLEHADILTTSVLLEAAGRIESGWLRRADGANLSPALLIDVDQAWSRATRGKHGFLAQLALHNHPPGGGQVGRARDFSALALALGWKVSPMKVVDRYTEFMRRSEYPSGFFPTLRNPQAELSQIWHDQWMETVMAVHMTIRRWAGQP